MTSQHGKFVWYELMTSDTKAAQEFYGKVVGWQAKDAGMPGMDYTLVSAGDVQVAGLMAMPQAYKDAGGRPGWIGYVAVDDVDASARKVTELGGQVHRQPDDIPGIGRFSVIADPGGAMISLFKGTSEPPNFKMDAPGQVGWHELMAGELESAVAFYSALFGWAKGDAMDMGPMGVYQLFKHQASDATAMGGMMTKPAELPAPFWTYYFNVDVLAPAIERLKAAGGTVINGPMEVPGPMWIVQAMDPQGAMFALLSAKA